MAGRGLWAGAGRLPLPTWEASRCHGGEHKTVCGCLFPSISVCAAGPSPSDTCPSTPCHPLHSLPPPYRPSSECSPPTLTALTGSPSASEHSARLSAMATLYASMRATWS